MKYLLDANVCIQYLNGHSERIKQKIELYQTSQEIVLCSIIRAELRYGALKSRNPQKILAKQQKFIDYLPSLPFNDTAAKFYSEIRASLEKRGTPIGPNDLLIASIALANGLVLITHNIREFGRIDSLVIDDWET